MRILASNSQKFGWITLVNIFPTTVAGDPKSILKNHTSVTLLQVKKQARISWGDIAAAFDELSDAANCPRFFLG